jgi:hypothetical protein
MFVGTYTMRISLDDKGSQNAPLGHTAYIQAEAPNLPLSPPENPRLHSKQHTDGNDKTSRGPGWQTEDKNDESPTGGHIRAVAKGSGAQADWKDCKFSVCTAPAIVLNPPQTLCFSITTYRAGAAVWITPLGTWVERDRMTIALGQLLPTVRTNKFVWSCGVWPLLQYSWWRWIWTRYWHSQKGRQGRSCSPGPEGPSRLLMKQILAPWGEVDDRATLGTCLLFDFSNWVCKHACMAGVDL